MRGPFAVSRPDSPVRLRFQRPVPLGDLVADEPTEDLVPDTSPLKLQAPIGSPGTG